MVVPLQHWMTLWIRFRQLRRSPYRPELLLQEFKQEIVDGYGMVEGVINIFHYNYSAGVSDSGNYSLVDPPTSCNSVARLYPSEFCLNLKR